jgi:phosphoribosylformylglycinamidine synthase subunit PurQ / glutaminase
MSPKVLILRAPGANCDREAAFAFERAGGKSTLLHVNRLLERPAALAEHQILCIPGGFSYGDDISAGRILANQIRHHLFDALQQFKADGKLIIGICNGFQILIKSGLILPDKADEPAATLAANRSGKFEDRWINLARTSDKCVWLRGLERMYLPVAHGEGQFIARDDATLDALDRSGQLCLRYTSADGRSHDVPYPLNPNGAQRNIAGVCDDSGRVLGLMPHPERHVDPTHHPRWTRRDVQPDKGDGLQMFENAVAYFG